MATQTINYDINVNTGDATNSIGNLEKELDVLKNKLSTVEIGSDDFNKLTAEIQATERELKKVNATVEGFTLEKKLEVADGAIKVVAGSVAGLTGAIGLLGIESEQFDKLTAQAANAIAFGMGIKDASEGVGKLAKNLSVATVKNKIFAVGQKAVNIVTAAFNAIMTLNPVAIVILSITALIGLLVTLKDKFEVINNLFEGFTRLARAAAEFLGLAETEEEAAARKAKERNEQRVKDIDNELKIRKAAGEETIELEREKQRLLTQLTEEGSQERKDAEADLAAFEAAQLKKKQDDIDAANKIASDKRKANREKIAKEKADQKKKDDEAAEKKKKEDADKETARLKAIADVVLEIQQATEDREDETRLAKLEREEERRILALEKLGEDNEAIKAVEDYYRELKKEAEVLDNEDRDARETEATNKKIAGLFEQIDTEARLEMDRVQMKQFALDSIIGLVNAESAIGKAALIAKQILSAKEMIIDAKTALSKVNVAAAKAAADTSTGFAATLKAGFPENIPLLIAYAAQAASIISAIGKAVSKSKAAIGKASGGIAAGGGDSISQPSGIAASPPSSSPNFEIGTAPETQVDNNIIQTYVISGDITSSQEAESKLNSRRQISG